MLRILLILSIIHLVRPIQIQQRYSIGDQFTYEENRTTTTVNLFTEEKTTKQQQTIYTERIVELDDSLTNSNRGEVEKSYSFVQFTPSDECATQRLLSKRFRETFQRVVESSSIQYVVGQRWKDKTSFNLDRYTTVIRIYGSEEYHTEVIVFDMEILGAIELLEYQRPAHFLVRKEVDVETGILLSEQIIQQITVNDNRKTDVIVKKLIQRQTSSDAQ